MAPRRESRQIVEWIDAPAKAVYDHASDPAHLPEWAPGLGSAVEREGDDWFVVTPTGRAGIAFVPRNDLGVLDHTVTLASGEVFFNPMRVVADGEASEVSFTLRRQDGMSDAEFERDAAAVASDLAALKRVVERRLAEDQQPR